MTRMTWMTKVTEMTRVTGMTVMEKIERFSYDLEMRIHKQNRNKK